MRRQIPLEEQTIPTIHPKIDLKHIKPNGKFIDDEEINDIIQKMRVRDANFKDYAYGEVILVNGKYYATYDNSILGEGAFGQVVIAQDLDDKNNMVAVKKLQFFHKDEKRRREKQRIARHEESVLVKAQLSPGSTNVRNANLIVMKLGSGVELSSLSKTPRTIPTIKLLKIASNMLDAIGELHGNNLLHRDIKGQNLLVDLMTERVTPIDLGFAIEAKNDAQVKANFAGTKGYMAPECNPPQELYSTKSDVYALGKTLGRMLGIVRDKELDQPIGLMESRQSGIPRELVVLEKDDPDYIYNTLIPDITVRDLIRQLIVNMTHPNFAQRLTLAEAKRTLKTIIENHLMLPAKIINTGILDVEEYQKSTPAERNHLIRALQNCDEVLFVDKKQPKISSQELLVIHRELEKNNVNISHKIFNGDTVKSAIDQLPEYLDRQQPDRINTYFLVTRDMKLANDAKAKNNKIIPLVVTPQKTVTDYQKEILEHLKKTKVDPKHIAVVIKSLKEELVRLEGKYGKDKEDLSIGKQRINLIENYLEKIDLTKDKLTYAGLIGSLETLQQRMTATGGFSRLFGKRSTGAVHIDTVRMAIDTEIKNETEIRFKRK